jgi:ATP-dependent Clp protease ATP-binding subunit ClpA
VLELAVDEARRMGHHYIGTEHLLLGLVRLTEGVAIDILKRLGLARKRCVGRRAAFYRRVPCNLKIQIRRSLVRPAVPVRLMGGKPHW